MATSDTTQEFVENLQQLRDTEGQLTLQKERFRVRAQDIQRRKLVLENELQSPGISDAEREYLTQRLQELSNQEDALGQGLAKAERELGEVSREIAEQERQVQVRQKTSIPTTYAQSVGERRNAIVGTRAALANRLYAIRQQYLLLKGEDNRELNTAKKEIKPPGKLLYFCLISIAVGADLFGLIELTGIGVVVVFIVNLFFSAFFLVAGLWLGRKIKRVRVSGERISNVITGVEQRILLYRQRTALVLKFARRTAAGRSILRSKLGRKAVVLTAKLFKFTRLPLVRNIATEILELIPFINLLPWYTINMVLTYREHKKEYVSSVQTVDEYPATFSEEVDAFQSLQEAQVAALQLT